MYTQHQTNQEIMTIKHVMFKWYWGYILMVVVHGAYSCRSEGLNNSHCPLNETDIFEMHYLQWRFSYFIDICSVPKCPVDNKSALVQWMAWYQTGDKPLPESMLTQYTDAFHEWHQKCADDYTTIQYFFSSNDYYSFMFITYQMYKISQFQTFLQG